MRRQLGAFGHRLEDLVLHPGAKTPRCQMGPREIPCEEPARWRAVHFIDQGRRGYRKVSRQACEVHGEAHAAEHRRTVIGGGS